RGLIDTTIPYCSVSCRKSDLRQSMVAHSGPTTKNRRTFLTRRIREAAGKALIIGLMLALCSCTIYRPRLGVDLNSLPQARTQSSGKVRISAAVLTAEESERVFGVRVYDSGVQPVWLSIENHDTVPYAILSGSVDQNRFSPLEAAYRNHYRLFLFANDQMNAYFLQNDMAPIIPPGRTVSGFVYTNKELGAKYAQVTLVGPKGTEPKFLSFLLPVPGLQTHYNALLMSGSSGPQE